MLTDFRRDNWSLWSLYQLGMIDAINDWCSHILIFCGKKDSWKYDFKIMDSNVMMNHIFNYPNYNFHLNFRIGSSFRMRNLIKGIDNIFVTSHGDIFVFDGVNYHPIAEIKSPVLDYANLYIEVDEQLAKYLNLPSNRFDYFEECVSCFPDLRDFSFIVHGLDFTEEYVRPIFDDYGSWYDLTASNTHTGQEMYNDAYDDVTTYVNDVLNIPVGSYHDDEK